MMNISSLIYNDYIDENNEYLIFFIFLLNFTYYCMYY